jgi:hypothetical protein
MHELYKLQEEAVDGRVLGYAKYLHVFNSLGLKFGRYSCDTCATCDSLNEKIQEDNGDDEAKAELEQHLREADIAYQQQIFDYEASKDRSKKFESLWFDMAAIIQVPRTNSGKAFYLRKHKVYMEGFHRGSTKQNHMYL